MKKFALLLAAGFMSSVAMAEVTKDEIINTYFENTGGLEAWGKVESIRMTGEFNQGSMKFPVTLVQMKDGRSYMEFEFQGKKLKQGVFDGETVWSTNFMTMKAEKADSEQTENTKLNINDFPDALYNYKEKGYSLEMLGEETIDGVETYKLKLTKEPVTIEGKKVDDVTYYYFDKDSMIPLVQETEIKSGPAKGQISQVKASDFQEVEGLYFPFSIAQGIKGGQSAPIEIKTIELNVDVDPSEFSMPKADEKNK
ncbi:outer membrane lipoprotein-sorting protein [Kangiella sp. HZ709]|uniref:outer membrane lipoprotein-sorting protein n=1 Tax=Kangiella sp. HZ709 TaxID=2666328 RepID=UPI0012AF61CE|nr:outer membrane lipoprotein-sorting protein [Kangiella sp. HZ709]MRX28557.1 outer membrane lipoprotein-sorting protein [Kangiella sp. HZ709]